MKTFTDAEILDWIISRSTLGLRNFEEPVMLLIGNECLCPKGGGPTKFKQDVLSAITEHMNYECGEVNCPQCGQELRKKYSSCRCGPRGPVGN